MQDRRSFAPAARIRASHLQAVSLSPLITVAQAASALGVSSRTVRRRVAKGLLPAHRITGRLYIKREDLRAFIECHREIS